MGSFSLTHLLLIAVIALLFFGPKRLPSLGQSLGKAIKGFKDGLNGDDEETQGGQRSVGSNRPQELPGSSQQAQSERHADKEKDPQNKG
ncbi:MAG: twin-arginine translocase TatA/TatE family subunit [Bdellovibrionaceae bacterium]|nr:twin-arginine translocase TatA/TatE family subunit [Pseudobdellovibrionaceae bacterium]